MTLGVLDLSLAAVAAVAAAALSWSAARRARDRPSTAPALASPGGSADAADALLDGIPDPIVRLDERARVVAANRAARTLLPALTEGDPLSLALRSPDVLEAVDKVVRTRDPLEVDFALRVPVDRRFSVRIAALDADVRRPGRGVSVLMFFRDLTPAWRIERMRTEFVASASHELRTPLASILGFIETLQGPARDDPAARERFLEIMRDQASRMARLIDDLLSLARIEMRAHLPVTDVVDLDAVVARVCQALEPLARERSVTIAVAGPEEPSRVLGDRDELVRVVENIVENAIKYGGGGGGGRIEVRVVSRDGVGASQRTVELAVSDRGPGIAPEHLPRLTERFYRVDASASRQQGGTGLGLALVKHIVNRHRGRLAIESEPGKGTTVRVLLPGLHER